MAKASEASVEYPLWYAEWRARAPLQIAHMAHFLCDLQQQGPFDLDGLLWLEFEAWDHLVAGTEEPYLHYLFRHDDIRRTYRGLRDRPPTEPPLGFSWGPGQELLTYFVRNNALQRDIWANMHARYYVSLTAALATASLQGTIDRKRDLGESFLFGHLVMGQNCKTLADEGPLRDWAIRAMILMKRAGNPLYAQWTEKTLGERMRASDEMLGPFWALRPEQGDGVCFPGKLKPVADKEHKGLVRFWRKAENGGTVYVTLATGLAMVFPTLFPLGPPPLPNGTVMEQMRSLLHFFRDPHGTWVNTAVSTGRVAGLMQLWVFALIEEQRIRYQLSRELLNHEAKTRHESVGMCRNTDFPTCDGWERKYRRQGNATCAVLGPPSILMTITFHDGQVHELIDEAIAGSNQSRVFADGKAAFAADVARQLLQLLRESSGRKLCDLPGLPAPTGMLGRIEYQNRGGVHWHLLLFFARLLTDAELLRVVCNRFPSEGTTLWDIITRYAMHACTIRCGGHINPANCSYKFPKEVRDLIQRLAGWLELPRGPGDELVVETCPLLAKLLGAHVHFRLMETSSMDAVKYIMNYLQKGEPATPLATPHSLLQEAVSQRVIGVSEAHWRIRGHDVTLGTVPSVDLMLKLPEEMTVAFRVRTKGGGSRVVGSPPILAYLNRSDALEDLDAIRWLSENKIVAATAEQRTDLGRAPVWTRPLVPLPAGSLAATVPADFWTPVPDIPEPPPPQELRANRRTSFKTQPAHPAARLA
jgi:hypothetical protein